MKYYQLKKTGAWTELTVKNIIERLEEMTEDQFNKFIEEFDKEYYNTCYESEDKLATCRVNVYGESRETTENDFILSAPNKRKAASNAMQMVRDEIEYAEFLDEYVIDIDGDYIGFRG